MGAAVTDENMMPQAFQEFVSQKHYFNRFVFATLITALFLNGCVSSGRTSSAASDKAASSKVTPIQKHNFFKWDVESETTSIGRIYGYFGTTTRDCAIAHTGRCSMKLVVRGNDSGNQQLGADGHLNPYPFKFVDAPALYYRWWMRIEPGFRWGRGTAKTKSSRTGGGPVSSRGTMAQGYTGYIQHYGFLIGECEAAGCRQNNGRPTTDDYGIYIPFDFEAMDDGKWHEYIVRVKSNGSATCAVPRNCDGEFEAWVDGKWIGEYKNFKLHSSPDHTMVEGWGSWMVTPYFQLNGNEGDGGTVYVDDFSTDNFYNSLIR